MCVCTLCILDKTLPEPYWIVVDRDVDMPEFAFHVVIMCVRVHSTAGTKKHNEASVCLKLDSENIKRHNFDADTNSNSDESKA